MFKVDFDLIFKEIQEFPFEHLGNISGKLRGKCDKSISKSNKSILSIFTVIIGFYLFSNAIIKKVGIGPFNIEDVNFILYFMPLAISYMLWTMISNLYNSALFNYMIYIIELRQFGYSHRSKLILMSLPWTETLNPDKNNPTTKKGCRQGCTGCLVVLPTIAIILVALLLIPLIYVFVIYYSITNYHITFYESRLLYWIPTIFTFVFVFNSIIPLYKLYKLYKFSNYRYNHVNSFDEEE